MGLLRFALANSQEHLLRFTPYLVVNAKITLNHRIIPYLKSSRTNRSGYVEWSLPINQYLPVAAKTRRWTDAKNATKQSSPQAMQTSDLQKTGNANCLESGQRKIGQSKACLMDARISVHKELFRKEAILHIETSTCRETTVRNITKGLRKSAKNLINSITCSNKKSSEVKHRKLGQSNYSGNLEEKARWRRRISTWSPYDERNLNETKTLYCGAKFEAQKGWFDSELTEGYGSSRF